MGPLLCRNDAGGWGCVSRPPYGAHIPALPPQAVWAPTSPGGESCLTSLRPAPSGFWMAGELGSCPDSPTRPGYCLVPAASIFMREARVLVVRHPAKQRSNNPEVVYNLPILRRSGTGSNEEGKLGLWGQLAWVQIPPPPLKLDDPERVPISL